MKLNFSSGILFVLLLGYIIFIMLYTPKAFANFFYNGIIQFILILLLILLINLNKSLGIVYFIAYLATYYRLMSQIERFSVVEDDTAKIVQYDKDSLLNKLQDKEEDVEGVWGCSALGKNMGLCKA